MAWDCVQCGSKHSDYVAVCSCGGKPSEKVQPKADTPVEHAKAARLNGAKLFQVILPVSSTSGSVSLFQIGTPSTYTVQSENTVVLELIEAEGWRIEHANFVYQVTSTESRNTIINGKQEAVSGAIVGVYLFRRAAE